MLWASIKRFLHFFLCLFVWLGVTGEAKGAVKRYLSFTTDYPPVYEVSGFDVVSRLEVFSVFDKAQKSHFFTWAGSTYQLVWLSKVGKIEIRLDKKTLASIDVWEAVEKAKSYLSSNVKSSRFSVPQKFLTVQKENKKIKARVFFDDISLEIENNKRIFAHFKSDVYLKFK